MSFTSIRRFWTIMKELGYPHVISMESFRWPNFEFVANCLYWLILRYDPTIDLEKNISTEASRINFVKSATKLMLARAKIKLNPKHIYSADGYAVKELLKIAIILQLATEKAIKLPHDNIEVATIAKPIGAKATRIFVNEITKCGTTLYDMLDAEPKFKEQRDQTLIVNRNMDEMEHNLREAIETMMKKITEVDQEICHAEDTKKSLRSKCEKRKLELEQSEKRLSSLQNVKPTYIDQYDEMQVHMHKLFAQYIEKFQNLKWLETQMETHTRDKQERLNEIDRRMRRLQRSIQNEE
ncbi:hypothetical protein KC19_7G121700 [Ceratodon purpureus]|uniref:Clusterin-associated protein 1 n=1 Tax=Ceratodon purpureus TaxID=3225 RepID=A0A8T0H795_CERPU|nr:hypothetical protein KC19_7G121700 [Ceratodon purpureus]